MPTATNLLAHAEALEEPWSPRIVGQVNDQFVKVAKLDGTFAWHSHEHEDELFLVLKGRLRIDLEEGSVTLCEGDFYVVPKGTRHCPVADEACWIALIETVTTLHTGDVVTPLTKSIDQQRGADNR